MPAKLRGKSHFQIEPLFNIYGLSKKMGVARDKAFKAMSKEINSLAKQMQARLKELTPKYDPTKRVYEAAKWDGDHIADYWEVRARHTNQYRHQTIVDVLNTHPRAYKRVKVGTGYSNLLSILEYGARGHDIVARKAPNLLFFWPKIGAIRVAKKTHHSGFAPYGMMSKAKAELIRKSPKVLDVGARVMAAAFASMNVKGK